MRIVVLFHEDCRQVHSYFISAAARIWREQGHHVKYLFGTGEFCPADVCILHVDLTIVPEDYLEFASLFPVTVNGRVSDIRKSSFSKNLVDADSDYRGSVIVKTDENFAGWPERLLAENRLVLGLARLTRRLRRPRIRFTDSFDYRIYPGYDDVPARYRSDPRFVIEKFIPEMEDGYYVCHSYVFFGDVHHGFREYSPDPIVKTGSSVMTMSETPHDEMVKARYEMDFEYGKFDYCISGNKVHLLDVNKTFGVPSFVDRSKFESVTENRANGLFTIVNLDAGVEPTEACCPN